MLIRFRVKNFLSFHDEVEFSMIPGASQLHPDHVLSIRKSGISVLRSGIVYGANASGKSNLIKCIEFAKDFIVEGVKPKESIAVKPFKLDRACADQPSKFEFEFSSNEKCYLYGFELTPTLVVEEWLYEIKKTTEKMVFERRTNSQNKTEVEFGKKQGSRKAQDFLQEFSSGTRPNQLFLSKCYEDENITYYDEVMEWFEKLIVIFPESQYREWPFQVAREEDVTTLVNYLESFDTGVCGFSTEEINPEKYIPKTIIDNSTINENEIQIVVDPRGFTYIFRKKEGAEIVAEKIVFKHHIEGCETDINFDFDEESDGTLRLIDLIPILMMKDTVFIIDELDRSIHPSLSYRLIEQFLANSNNSQLIVTTHEVQLLDLDLLRRDEVWFIEKDKKGASSLYSLEEFAPRHDKDIRKGYMLGRFGAIPVLGNIDFDVD
jgi:uncharacterized protein